MQIVRIEAFGFKSFVERTVVPLDKGITSIVGPNGCGKSNIVDAFRWVLGETRAKSLRGDLLEDVIFNGTDDLRPLGLAEVSITLRANEDDFFASLVSPKQEAEDLASSVKLEPEVSDVNTTNDEQGAHLSVIEGALSDAYEDVERSANGVSEENTDLENTKVETVNDIVVQDAPTKSRLVHRLHWLKNATEVQITRRLYRSGESEFFINRVACRLKDIKDLFTAVGLGARAYSIVAQGEVGRIVTAKSDERRKILEEASGVQGFRSKIAEASRRLKDSEQNLERLEDIRREVERQVSSLKRQASKAEGREKLETEIKEMEVGLAKDKYYRISNELSDAQTEINKVKEQEGIAQAELQKAQAEEQEARSDLMSVDVKGDDLRLKIDNLKEQISNIGQKKQNKVRRRTELEAYITSAEADLVKCSEKIARLNERRLRIDEEAASLLSERGALDEKINSELGADKRSELDDKNQECSQLKSEMDSLSKELSKNKEKYANSLGRLESLSGVEEEASGDSSDSYLSAICEVPDNYTVPFNALIRYFKNFSVTRDFLSIAKELSSGRGILNREALNFDETLSFNCFSSFVRATSGYEDFVKKFFSSAFLIHSDQEGIDHFRSSPNSSAILVTSEGKVYTANYVDYTSTSYSEAQLREELFKTKEEINKIEKDYYEKERKLEQIENEIVALSETVSEYILRKNAFDSEIAINETKTENLKSQKEEINNDLNDLESESNKTNLLKLENSNELADIVSFIASFDSSEEVGIQDELALLNTEYAELDKERQQGRSKLSNLANQVDELRQELDTKRSDGSAYLLDVQKRELEIENLFSRLEEIYGSFIIEEVRSASSEALLETVDRQAKEEGLSKLKRRIAREGAVDPESIARLKEERERLEGITSQQNDLKEATRMLNATIEKLTETSQERFLGTFERVKENFSMLIPRLFGGGRGSISLSDMENPLESGLEINVRPPGKNLKSMDLLSGGEKALCATALVFAMFIEKPSPICILDEVDAPLDDVNLGRFVAMVKEMSVRTQFLLITHNKLSMNAADNLIGVTMEQPGATKLISVSLQEAYAHVA